MLELENIENKKISPLPSYSDFLVFTANDVVAKIQEIQFDESNEFSFEGLPFFVSQDLLKRKLRRGDRIKVCTFVLEIIENYLSDEEVEEIREEEHSENYLDSELADKFKNLPTD